MLLPKTALAGREERQELEREEERGEGKFETSLIARCH